MQYTTKNSFCKKCKLYEKVKHSCIAGKGNIHSKILLLGECPGRLEDEYGEVFVGRSGKFLHQVLDSMGLDCYISNAVLCRPVDTTGGNKAPTPTEIECCRPFTIDLIQTMKPKIIVTIGRIALQQLLKVNLSMEAARGKQFYHPELGATIIPTYHPSYLMRVNDGRGDKKLNDEFFADLGLAKKVLEEAPTRRIASVPRSIKGGQEIEEYLEKACQAEAVAIDVETTSNKPRTCQITDISFCYEIGKGVHIAWEHIVEDTRRIELLRKLLESDIMKVFHNADFDVQCLRAAGFIVRKPMFDTMLGYHTVTMSFRRGTASSLYKLKTMAWFLTKQGGYESILDAYGGIVGIQKLQNTVSNRVLEKHLLFDEAELAAVSGLDYELDQCLLARSREVDDIKKKQMSDLKIAPKEFYSAMDSDVTFRIYKYLKILIDKDFAYSFYNIIMPLNYALLRIHENGIKINLPYVEKLIGENNIKAEEVKDKFFAKVGETFNLNSTDQLRDAIYNKLGAPRDNRYLTKKTKLPSTEEEAIIFHSKKIPALKLILDYREIQKQTSTYLEGYRKIVDDRHRVYPSYLQIGTVTGRVSCICEGTTISLVGGEKNIENVEPGDLVYCYDDDGNLRISEVISKRYSGFAKTVRVNWQSSGTGRTGFLITTPEHLFKTKYHGWVQAQNLKRYAKIYHLTKSKQANGRIRLYGTNSFQEFEEVVIKREYYKAESSKHAHHKNFDKSDNRVENIEILDHKDHVRIHYNELRKEGRMGWEHLRYYRPEPMKGRENPVWIEKSKEELEIMLHEAKGRLTKVSMDFGCFKRKCIEKGVDIKKIASMYSSNGIYLDEQSVVDAIAQFSDKKNPLTAASRYLGIGYYKLKKLCEDYGIEYNHMVTSVMPYKERHVWDLEIKDYPNFIANELCVHNSRAPNLQNIPRDNRIRNMIIPEEGHKLVVVDLSQVELRVIAMLSGDAAMIRAFESGHDFHMYTACAMFGVAVDDFDKENPKHSEFRSLAKSINFGMIYQMMAETLAADLGIPLKKAEEFYNRFYAAYPKVGEWTEYTKAFVRQHGYVETLYGRRRYLPNIYSSNEFTRSEAERQAINTPVQGTAGDICFFGLIRFQDWLDDNLKKTKSVGTVHDSILAEVPFDEVDEVCEILPKLMTEDIPKVTVPLKADLDILDRWTK